MKGDNGKGNNPLRDGWKTPSELFNLLNEQYKFKFDCCATNKDMKCLDFSSNFESINIIKKMAWMNPPFSIAWRMFEHYFKVIEQGVAIYRCDNFETGLWQKVIFPKCSWAFIPSRRVYYEGLDGVVRFPSALIGLNVDCPKEINGVILEVMHRED